MRLAESWPTRWQTVIVEERAYKTASFLVHQRKHFLPHCLEVANPSLVTRLAQHLGMERDTTLSEVRSENLLDNGTFRWAFDEMSTLFMARPCFNYVLLNQFTQGIIFQPLAQRFFLQAAETGCTIDAIHNDHLLWVEVVDEDG